MEIIRAMKPEEWLEVGHLIYEATNTWYENNGKEAVFNCSKGNLKFFCEVYEAMDPGCCLVVEIEGKIAASCFYHPRATHYSLGIMCVHPEYYGRGLAKKLLNKIISLAEKAELPLNLISSAMNLDSFSLYNKAGFVPTGFYQDMVISIPDTGFMFSDKELSGIRIAKKEDIAELVEIEMAIHGINHEKDLSYIISQSGNVWNCHLLEDNGEITGFLCSVNHESSKIIGLGAAKNESGALKLIKSHLNFYTGTSPLIIAPSTRNRLTGELLKLGAKNVELHISQTISKKVPESPSGVVIPTFMPE